eukprot:1187058-Prorocentrum_minimum.AAC.3
MVALAKQLAKTAHISGCKASHGRRQPRRTVSPVHASATPDTLSASGTILSSVLWSVSMARGLF